MLIKLFGAQLKIKFISARKVRILDDLKRPGAIYCAVLNYKKRYKCNNETAFGIIRKIEAEEKSND